MTINAKFFKATTGTVFAVIYTSVAGYTPRAGFRAPIAQGVFKTLAGANKCRDRIRAFGNDAEVRVGHFNASGDVDTL